MVSPRLLVVPVLAALAVGAFAGCAATPADAPSPTGTDPATQTELDAARLDGGRIIGLVTSGSSSCVPAADAATVEADGSLLVTLVEPDAETACTRDLVPRVTLVEVPEGVDPTQDLAIIVSGDGYSGQVELDGVTGLAGGGMTDYLPSAGWTDTDGQFVVLTWGSSSCAPVVDQVAASGPAEVTVTFQTPPADQVCTMDMAPRAFVAVVDGLEEDGDVSLVLTGTPGFDDVRIPIYGED